MINNTYLHLKAPKQKTENRMSKNSKSQKENQPSKAPEMNKVTTDEFNVKNFSIEPLICGPESSQYSGYCRYDFGKKKKMTATEKAENGSTKDRCIFVTKAIKIERGGIPSHSEKYRPTDNDRLYFWLNLDQDEGGRDLHDKVLKPLDDLFAEKINKKGNVDFMMETKKDKSLAPIKKLSFQPSVKMSMTSDDDDGTKKLEPYQRVKVKLSTFFEEGANKSTPQKIKTKVFVDGSSKPVEITCLKDLTEQFPWGCTAEFALEVNKTWAMKVESKGSRDCGYGLKCVAIKVLSKPKQSAQAQVSASIFGGDAVDSDAEDNVEESEDENKSENKPSEKSAKKSNTAEDSDSESDTASEKSEESTHSADESEESSDSEHEAPVKPVKKTGSDKKDAGKNSKKKNTVQESESDDESAVDSEEENKKKPAKEAKKTATSAKGSKASKKN